MAVNNEDVMKGLEEFMEAHKKMAEAAKKLTGEPKKEETESVEDDVPASIECVDFTAVRNMLTAIKDISGAELVTLNIIDGEGEATTLTLEDVEEENI